MPHKISNYYELFIGGGSVFFKLQGMTAQFWKYAQKPKACLICDKNKELIRAYKTIRDNMKELMPKLYAFREMHTRKDYKKQYDKVRANRTLTNPIEKAARFIYLNRVCYNGKYEEDKEGNFITTAGRYRNSGFWDVENIPSVHRSLQNVSIENKSFEEIKVKPRSVVYCDPPYLYTQIKYLKDTFTEEKHTLLRDKALEWRAEGSRVIISNSDETIYKGLIPKR